MTQEEQLNQIINALNGTNERLDNLHIYIKERDEKIAEKELQEKQIQEQKETEQKELKQKELEQKETQTVEPTTDYTAVLSDIHASTVKLNDDLKLVQDINKTGNSVLLILYVPICLLTGIIFARIFWRKM